jgi:hypothetical protein
MLLKHNAGEKGAKNMLKQTLKRMVLTGVTVMVLMSTAAPAAMAAQASYYDDDPKTLQFCIIIWCPS